MDLLNRKSYISAYFLGYSKKKPITDFDFIFSEVT